MIEPKTPPEYPGSDPTQRLSETGKRILAAARRILAENGFAGLSVDAIAREAGENKSSVHYHFGGKAGLLAALVDSVMYDDYLDEIRVAAGPESAPMDEVATLVTTSRTSAIDRESYQTYFDLFPLIARDEELRKRMAIVYRWYREMDLWALTPAVASDARDRLEVLAALTVAVADGVAMQRLSDPSFDSDRAFDMWDAIIRLVLEDFEKLPGGET